MIIVELYRTGMPTQCLEAVAAKLLSDSSCRTVLDNRPADGPDIGCRSIPAWEDCINPALFFLCRNRLTFFLSCAIL